MEQYGLSSLVAQVHKETQLEKGTTLEDAGSRKELLSLAKQLVFMLEPPEDLIFTQVVTGNVNLALRVLAELKVFKILAEAGNTIAASQLAEITSCDELLLVRCMRAACAVHFVDEAGINEYRANKVTRAFATPGLEGIYGMLFDNQVRPKSLIWEFINYFRKHGYHNPESDTEGPLQIANDCIGQNAFDFWFSDPYPDEAIRFNTVSTSVRVIKILEPPGVLRKEAQCSQLSC